jgi:hypothetical protein
MLDLKERLRNLKKDLMDKGGPKVSTMTNYPLALFVYQPQEELQLKKELNHLRDTLSVASFTVKEISLMDCLIKKLKVQSEDDIDYIISGEKEMFKNSKNWNESIQYLEEQIINDIEGENGIVHIVRQEIEIFSKNIQTKNGVIFITRAGSLYPFYRTSNLLHFLTEAISYPVILFYPGTRVDDSSLSFMGKTKAYSNYRPRIY